MSSATAPIPTPPNSAAKRTEFVASAARVSALLAPKYAFADCTPIATASAVSVEIVVRKATWPRPAGPSVRETTRTFASPNTDAPTLVAYVATAERVVERRAPVTGAVVSTSGGTSLTPAAARESSSEPSRSPFDDQVDVLLHPGLPARTVRVQLEVPRHEVEPVREGQVDENRGLRVHADRGAIFAHGRLLPGRDGRHENFDDRPAQREAPPPAALADQEVVQVEQRQSTCAGVIPVYDPGQAVPFDEKVPAMEVTVRESPGHVRQRCIEAFRHALNHAGDVGTNGGRDDLRTLRKGRRFAFPGNSVQRDDELHRLGRDPFVDCGRRCPRETALECPAPEADGAVAERPGNPIPDDRRQRPCLEEFERGALLLGQAAAGAEAHAQDPFLADEDDDTLPNLRLASRADVREPQRVLEDRRLRAGLLPSGDRRTQRKFRGGRFETVDQREWSIQVAEQAGDKAVAGAAKRDPCRLLLCTQM